MAWLAISRGGQGPGGGHGRALVGTGLDAQFPAGEHGALAHGTQAETRARPGGPLEGLNEADAIVRDRQPQGPRPPSQAHVQDPATTVFDGIGGGLLQDAKDGGLEGGGDVRLGQVEVVPDLQVGVEPGESGKVPART